MRARDALQMFFRVIRQCTEQLEKVRVAELKKAEYMLAQSKETEKAMLEGGFVRKTPGLLVCIPLVAQVGGRCA